MKAQATRIRRRPELALMGAFWQVNRRAFLTLTGVLLLAAAAAHAWSPTLRGSEVARTVAYMTFGLSLFCVFGFANFTESDRRGRRAGFPSRLFTLPVSTLGLVTWPLVAAITTLLAAYFGWVSLVFPSLGISLPAGWHCTYLASGMSCFLAIVWALSGFPVLRVAVLGVGGTIFPIAWTAFTAEAADSWMAPYLPGGSLVWVRSAFLGLLGFAAYGVALFAVGRQRRGGRLSWDGWRRLAEALAETVSRRAVGFPSGSRALAWQEWRRQGCILPGCVGLILGLIGVVSAMGRPIGAQTAMLTLFWLLLAPIALAWGIGKGFGKIDLWLNEPPFPTFFAVRPVRDEEWIAVKLQVAAKSVLFTWLSIGVVTPLWLLWCCDYSPLTDLWGLLSSHYSAARLYAISLLVLASAALWTWRLLAGSLCVGLSGSRLWMNLSICYVFLAAFATMFFGIWCQNDPAGARGLLVLPGWLPWAITLVFAAKMLLAALFVARAVRLGGVSMRRVKTYLGAWLGGTGVFVALVWTAVPSGGWPRYLLCSLALFGMPALRLSVAPFALARHRHGNRSFGLESLLNWANGGLPGCFAVFTIVISAGFAFAATRSGGSLSILDLWR